MYSQEIEKSYLNTLKEYSLDEGNTTEIMKNQLIIKFFKMCMHNSKKY